MTQQAQIGLTGLATMGRNVARNLARNGFVVAVHNRTDAKTRDLVEHFGDEGTFVPSYEVADFVASLERPRKVLIMVAAGGPTDAVIDEVAPLLEEGDIVCDLGNAHFLDTRRREEALRDKGIHFVGIGVSGGEEGALRGPSIMPGGSAEAYAALGPILEAVAADVDGSPCCTHVGPGGAGHFVKMVHNGIEYAQLQLIAEVYDLLAQVGGMSAADIAAVFATWNEGPLGSYLVETTATVLGHVDAATGGPFVEVVDDAAQQKGTGSWTVSTALDLGAPVPTIAEAVFARSLSGHGDLRAAGQGLPGPAPTVAPDVDHLVAALGQALDAATLVSFAQGFDDIAAASEAYDWGIDRGEIARIWRGGCIIRAAALEPMRAALTADPGRATLLDDAAFADRLAADQDGWREVVALATRAGVPVPALSSAVAYYDTIRADRLPTALVQGTRDFFGSHTYARTDREGKFHTTWASDVAEVPA